MTHAGHSYHENSADGIAAVAEQERLAIVTAAEKIRAAGIPCPIVCAARRRPRCIRATSPASPRCGRASTVFNDLDQEFIGSCGAGDLALSVLASVIGHYPHRNQMLIDAGALALSKDISAQEFQPKVGFGTIAECAGEGHGRDRLLAGARLRRLGRSDPLRQPAGRQRVRVLPNHACITAAAYDRYYVVDSDLDGGKSVVDIYDRINGW